MESVVGFGLYRYIYILGGGFLESLPPYIYIFKMKKARLMFVSYCLHAQWCGGESRVQSRVQFRYSDTVSVSIQRYSVKFDTAIRCQNDKKRKSVTLS